MSNSLINISEKLDRPTVALYRAVSEAAAKVGAEFIVVGASARDLLLQHGYGLRIVRATADTDFGVQVSTWDQFDSLRTELISMGFRDTRMLHRLISPEELKIDIVPFGQIENGSADISWPPDNDVVMNVLGFRDALRNSESVRVAESPNLDISIASAPGLALLKTIAWTDRPLDIRRKDAQDLLYLCESYERLPCVELYDDQNLLTRFDADITQVGAYLLGQHVELICSDDSRQYVQEFLNGNLDDRSFEDLIDDSMEVAFGDRERNERILSAFLSGFSEQNGEVK